ncbi:bifunctional diguanylate cyclase/phosphodiesterase [Pseudomaricurvus alkylphenolicus]|jgi:diguanylate cyclase (GGDEF)-like protein|uniref:putative bifunctional diguanylate cyclase/phosphodiesterase n=1 Tax=Pseudomaricurvus alkylphenolicus TaxID=1306991 RepID=UPI001423816C|nr:bifunctional diguanylate cyclase/phosphodiesterase [Pseudomaricurvus alkylphenolicus]NIB44284.1 bifunctional diguanylate cyclase/phosphodiesterase [Pseudomaricurvus alkylphenolicus]
MKFQFLSARQSILVNVVAGPLLILLLALSGLLLEANFLYDQHALLKRQQSSARTAAELNIALKNQTQAWSDYLLHASVNNETGLWTQFRMRERATLELANELLVKIDDEDLHRQIRTIIYALEVLRIAYQESRAGFLNDSGNPGAANMQVRNIDQTPSTLIENLYQNIEFQAEAASEELRERSVRLSGLFAALLLLATIIYIRFSGRHIRRLLDKQDRSHQRVQWLLKHDYLTRLLTRNSLIQEIENNIQEKQSLYIFHISLSNIKDAAQSHGHSLQDQLIRVAARRLSSEKRPQDLLARSIGEEFVLLVRDDENLVVRSYARQLLSKVNTDFSVAGFRYQIAGAMGISHYPSHADDCASLLQKADIAAVHSRTRNLQSPCVFAPAMTNNILKKFELVDELKQAIYLHQLEVVFQPQVNLQTRKIVGLEALARLTTDNPQLNSPQVFIPLAEETGLIHRLGKLVFQRALQPFAQWSEQHPELNLSINVSARQLEAPDFADVAASACRDFRVACERVDIELTESNYIDGHHPQLDRLRESGFRLSIDDFGTGYSNLGYLARFVPQQLKIDKSFVDKITESDRSHALVQSMVGLAQSQQIEVVAEGIETEIQAHILKQMGVDVGQGYLFSKPVDAAGIDTFLNKDRRQLKASGQLVSLYPQNFS